MKALKPILLGLFVAACAGALADDFDRAVASIAVLLNKPVQDDMKITEAQRKKMNDIAVPFNKKLNEIYQKKNPTQADQQKLRTEMEKMKSAVLKALSEAQVKRLREITLQSLGIGALGDDMVAKRVGLNPAQQKTIRADLTDGMKRANALTTEYDAKAKKGIREPKTEAERKKAIEQYQKNAKALGGEYQKKIAAIQSSVNTKVMAQMTAANKSAWQALLGRQFKVTG